MELIVDEGEPGNSITGEGRFREWGRKEAGASDDKFIDFKERCDDDVFRELVKVLPRDAEEAIAAVT